METVVIRRLLDLNRQFYQTFGRDFSATRQRLQPGVTRLLGSVEGSGSVLDLGCGNGGLARALARRGFPGMYLGLDFSLPLLQEVGELPGNFIFTEADLTTSGWEEMVRLVVAGSGADVQSAGGRADRTGAEEAPRKVASFDFIFCFAVLHHIPSRTLRLEILEKVHALLSPGGRFIHSNWQFLNSEKLRGRIQPWTVAGLYDVDVDPNDYLLDWRSGGRGLRYVHHFDQAELEALASEAGFRVRETFISDGENGRLGLYQVWEKI
ncbi:MAG: class I SAM-dependent methyltransferase [Chloroflexi bacterium]|nr:class I SAM-dependent methyltransferase [Chloroflexota bacterium]